MYWFAGIAMCLIIALVTWYLSEDHRQRLAYNKLDDLARFCDTAFAHVCYCELKHDRKLILQFIEDATITGQPLAVCMLNDALKHVDTKLAEFSDEEKQIYDVLDQNSYELDGLGNRPGKV